MRFIFLMVGVLLAMTACKSMSERGTASVNPQASTEETTPAKETPLNKYYQNILKKKEVQVADGSHRRWERCDENEGTSCMKVTCAQKAYDCSFQHNLEKVMGLCRNSDGACIEDVCSQKAYDCSFQHNLEKVATMCRDANGSCVKSVCSQRAYDCSFQHNLEKVVGACKDADGGCVRDICEQGAYDCSFRHNLEKVLTMCSKHRN